MRRQLSETHKEEYQLLKEQMISSELALQKSQTSEEQLKVQVTQLIQKKQEVVIELEMIKESVQQLIQ